MVRNASNKLEEQKEYVNSLNVFPVPDGDTGTNMSLTFKAAVTDLEGLDSKSIGEVSKRLAKGALMGARGNSGVILSQIFRGIAKGLEGKTEANIEDIKASMVEGANFAYKAVMRPTEGTILTIIKAAGEAAMSSNSEDITSLLQDICKHSKVMLDKTPEMLPQLKQAKVVDAGGMGLLILLNGMLEALSKDLEVELFGEGQVKDNSDSFQPLESNINPADIKFGYCTEFLILSENVNIPNFKDELEKRGDSIVLVGLEDIVKVHIHTNDPGEVLSMAVKMGELSKIKIDNMREQHRSLLVEDTIIGKATEEAASESYIEPPKKYGFVTVARGEGIKDIFEDLGVDEVIEGGQTMNPSTQDIVDSINKINAETIFVLPNNKNIIMAASQAVDIIDNKKVVVIPTKTIPQGITAITMFDVEGTTEENETTMNNSLANVTSGSVTYAVKDTEDNGRTIKEGNILGLLEGKISEIGTDIYEVCNRLIEAMVTEDSELITVFYGEDCEEERVEELVASLEEKYPDMDIQYFNGKQPLYYFITSVE
jgi:uncharacterized protein